MTFVWPAKTGKIEVRPLAIPDVKLIRTARFADHRGCFSETYQQADFAAAGIGQVFVQDNQAASHGAGTLRGLHFQIPPFAQTKLLRVLRGKIFDVAVDLRRSSASFGQHVAVELTDEGGEQLLVPAGFAHGYCTLESETVVFYKVDHVYSAVHERGLNWADPALGIVWPIDASGAILTKRDSGWPCLRELPDHFA